MKFLFIVQGEGRGHLTQAMTMERLLEANGHSVVQILVGKSKTRNLPAFFEQNVHAPVHHFESINFVASTNNKRPNTVMTVIHNWAIAFRFLPSVRMIRRTIVESGADMIINFYELLGTFGYEMSGRRIPMICVGHQFLFLNDNFFFPDFGYEGHIGLDVYSWAICKSATAVFALSFREMRGDDEHRIVVVPPLLRPEVISLRGENGKDDPALTDGGYILGYMLNSGFSKEVMDWHKSHPEVNLHFFWDNSDADPVEHVDDTLTFYYLNDREFVRQMAGCRAYASTAGFESICEAMYLGKPLMMVPTHIEQKCNAYDATKFGAAIASDSFDLSVLDDFTAHGFVPDEKFPEWARSANKVFMNEIMRVARAWNMNIRKKSKKHLDI